MSKSTKQSAGTARKAPVKKKAVRGDSLAGTKPKRPAKTKPTDNGNHPGGRPPLYDDPDKMQEQIDWYFNYCDTRIKTTKIDEDGNAVQAIVPEPYTMAGLAYTLGFTNRHALLEYEKRAKFSAIVKRARLKVEYDNERRLAEGKSPTGPIFWLKNHAGYRDKQEMEVTGDPVSEAIDRLSVAMEKRERGDAESNS